MILRSDPSPRYLLPPDAYFSEEWFERERKALFDRCWTLVASAGELTHPGDYVTATVGRSPLVVVAGEDGRLRAFQNLCRHRGAVLLSGTGNVGRTVNCFYHMWRYRLSGELTVIPQRKEQFAEIDPDQWGLLPAALEVWKGMVFVHPDPAAPSLSEALTDFTAGLGSHRPELLEQVAVSRIEVHCNWKLLVENHIDIYHLWYLHADSLGQFDHTKFEHRQIGPDWTSYEPLRGVGAAAESSPGILIDHLDDRDRCGIGAHLIFPNLMMAATAEFFATYVAEPVAADRCVLELRIRAAPGADGHRVLAEAEAFIREDLRACEAVQEGIGSPAFAVGPLARSLEAPIEIFHDQVLALMDARG